MLPLILALALPTAHAAPCANVSGAGPLKTCILRELADQEAFDTVSQTIVMDVVQRLATAEGQSAQLNQRVLDLEARLAALETFLTADVANDTLTVSTQFGDIVIDSGNTLTITTFDRMDVTSGAGLDITAEEHIGLIAHDHLSVHADENIAVTAAFDLDLTAGASGSLTAAQDLLLDANSIDLIALNAIDAAAGASATVAAGGIVSLEASVAQVNGLLSLAGDMLAPSIGALSQLESRVRNLETSP